jgi:hypothetical protein
VYNIQIIPNKLFIEISKAKKDLDVFIKLRLRLFLNSFNLYRVHYNTLRGNKIAKKLDKLSIKRVFKEFNI